VIVAVAILETISSIRQTPMDLLTGAAGCWETDSKMRPAPGQWAGNDVKPIGGAALLGRPVPRSALGRPAHRGRARQEAPAASCRTAKPDDLDPIWKDGLRHTRPRLMIDDTLFATGDSNAVKPQDVDTHDVSPTSSPGLSPCAAGWNGTTARRGGMTAEDCVASSSAGARATRWGQKLMDFVPTSRPGNDKDLRPEAEGSRGLVLDTLGKPFVNVQFMMPKRIAETIRSSRSTAGGYGPSSTSMPNPSLARKQSTSGNAKYKPRAEPPPAGPAARSPRSTGSKFIDMPDRSSKWERAHAVSRT